ncbi:MAG: L,D-transpeptidase [Akkermansia sp.]|nr:L,D-transpeptidase [Akkermansia sp.]
MKHCLNYLFAVVCAGLCCSCQSTEPEDMAAWYRKEGERLDAEARNKYKAKSFDAFVNGPGYRGSRDIWRGPAIQLHDPANSRVEVLLNEQRGRLYIGNRVAMDFPLCSGRVGGSETPRGTFRISQKEREEYRSNLYGSFIDPATERVVKSGVSVRDVPPPGTVFRGAEMPYWMRFNGAVGMHVGSVHRDAASHGCVRIPVEACSILYDKLAVGSLVIVK